MRETCAKPSPPVRFTLFYGKAKSEWAIWPELGRSARLSGEWLAHSLGQPRVRDCSRTRAGFDASIKHS